MVQNLGAIGRKKKSTSSCHLSQVYGGTTISLSSLEYPHTALYRNPAESMGLSVAANRFAASVPSTNSMESANIQNYGFDSTESAASIYTPSSTLISTIPAISYKLLGSSSNTRKSPLDMLLSNPIQFIKASWMSPIYKRNVTEAFGSSMPVSKNKKRATKV